MRWQMLSLIPYLPPGSPLCLLCTPSPVYPLASCVPPLPPKRGYLIYVFMLNSFIHIADCLFRSAILPVCPFAQRVRIIYVNRLCFPRTAKAPIF